MKDTTDYLILGAGPTGLGAALRLDELGLDWMLLEAEDHAGGLATSFVDDQGFTWDLGGHVQFSHYDRFDRYMDLALGPDGWLTHQRESWVWIRDRFVPYPFQNNLHRLDPADRWACVEGLWQAVQALDGSVQGLDKPANFAAWMERTMGPGICDLFLKPYNFKVWAYPPSTMDANWMGERVAVPDLKAVMRSICLNQDDVGWGPNKVFRFPVRGGTGAVWKALAARLPAARMRYGSRVARVEPEGRAVHTEAGDTIRARHILSTIPLNHLIRMSGGWVEAATADRLVYSSTHVVGIGIEGQPPEALRTKCWMYFPEAHSPYYRITVFTNYSPNNAPRPGAQWSLMTETSESPAKPVDAERLVADTLAALGKDRLLPDPDAVCSVVHRRLPQGYPTPFLGRDPVVDPVLRRFEEAGIWSRGRFGAWKYEVANQDHSFAQGYECVDRLAAGAGPEAEPTLHRPSWVNGRRNG